MYNRYKYTKRYAVQSQFFTFAIIIENGNFPDRFMDKYSFLNAANTAFFAQLYDEYLVNPDRVEPSWRAFFQGFDFGVESAGDGEVQVVYQDRGETKSVDVSSKMLKEFEVVRLIDGYRSRGHLFTKTNPVRDRRKYEPTLELCNFSDLSNSG